MGRELFFKEGWNPFPVRSVVARCGAPRRAGPVLLREFRKDAWCAVVGRGVSRCEALVLTSELV